ncbi:ribosome maturation factor RimP [Fodinicurvata halophila]|uniref:Ribosome maturation factor RimP n=1 Tax=Fodinicurvata halophila TaxID=1419723 RepID=A0ABV8UM99_9PROT
MPEHSNDNGTAVPELARTSEGKAADVERIIAPAVEDLGYEIVRVQLSGGARCPILQIMVERPERGMSVDDCAEVSRTVSALLDVEDPLSDSYELEVSSPGLDRPLTRLKDYERYAGFEAKLELDAPRKGRKRWRGRLRGLEDTTVLLQESETGEIERLPFGEIAKGKLVLTDDLLTAVQDGSNRNRD